jgi:hypothetical protein
MFAARKAHTERRHPPTGGGPPVKTRPEEEIYIQDHLYEPDMDGLADGFDTTGIDIRFVFRII